MLYPYIEFLKNTGLTIRLFRIQWHITAFNRLLVKWSNRLPNFLNFYKYSFKLGAYLSIALLPVAVVMLLLSVFSSSTDNSKTTGVATAQERPVSSTTEMVRLEILLPGVNLPLEQFTYYISAMFVCSVWHELGHALASVWNDVPVLGFGLHLIFIIPIAYTQIDTDHMNSAKIWKKLKIYSAGIWNNIILTALAYALLMISPIILGPLYKMNEGVVVTHLKPRSLLRGGENGLYIGDIITKVNNCPVKNEDDWLYCLKQTILNQPAYCVDDDFVQKNDESIQISHLKDGLVNCCEASDSMNCFENVLIEAQQNLPQYVCLNIRSAIENSNNYCHTADKKCELNSSCLKPILNNHSTIIHMKRENTEKDLIYYGHPAEAVRDITISEFVPKFKLLLSPNFGDILTTFLKYLCIFSSGLALINSFPCYGLDGYYLVQALITNLNSSRFNKSTKDLILVLINVFSASLLFIAVLKILWTTFIVSIF